ncbi:MAG TPA: hypothetical protein VK348_11705, partial [Planctomycetota bacterium]|nr:hypothetical protein [Planctomycetota bacterium]
LLTSERLSANPLSASCVPNLTAAETCMRQVLTGIRLLRLAVAWHLGEELPQLQDPLGTGALQVEHSDAAARFRSAGQVSGKCKERLAAAR